MYTPFFENSVLTKPCLTFCKKNHLQPALSSAKRKTPKNCLRGFIILWKNFILLNWQKVTSFLVYWVILNFRSSCNFGRMKKNRKRFFMEKLLWKRKNSFPVEKTLFYLTSRKWPLSSYTECTRKGKSWWKKFMFSRFWIFYIFSIISYSINGF